MAKKVAVVTGSNQGIGFEIVKKLCRRFEGVVFLTSRDVGRGKRAAEELKKQSLAPEFHQLDVSDRRSILKFKQHIEDKYGGIDILINNAAVANLGDMKDFSYETAKPIIDINFKGLLDIQELLYPLVRDNGKILNISSDCGHISNVRNAHWLKRLSSKDLKQEDIVEFVDWFLNSLKDGTFNPDDFADGSTIVAYRVSKVAMSALTILQQKELESRNISVNSMHPGLVATGMTLNTGFFSPEQAAETPVWIVLDAPESLKGAYIWYDRKVLDWYDANADLYFKASSLDKYKAK